MTTITEDYCSYEIARLLKEKGFEIDTNKDYWKIGEDGTMYFMSSIGAYTSNLNDKYAFYRPENSYPCPTHQMACKWLREKHQLHISVDVSPLYGKVKDEKGRNVCGLLYWDYIASGEWMNEKFSPFQRAFVVSAESNEQAIEKALKFSLENLI